MKAVILAGGEGSRLRPLTCNLPKPMAHICGRPILEYILDLLSKNKIDECVITLKYLPQIVKEHFYSGRYQHIRLQFTEETHPLGTAGGVKLAAKDFNEPFLVMSGDGMCDYELDKIIEYHNACSSDATIVAAKVEDPREYGLLQMESDGRVKGFIEKPGWSQATTNWANTGIYILEPSCLSLIPDDTNFDFAKDLFPEMLKKGMRINGYRAEGYWCDVGDLAAYVQCQKDVVEGKVHCKLPPQTAQGIYAKDSLPRGNYQLIPPVYIGSNVEISDGAIIGPSSVVEDGCFIGRDARVCGSILLENVYLAKGAHTADSVLCSGAAIKKDASLFEGSVIGTQSVVGANAVVKPGVFVWPGKRIENNSIVSSHLKYGNMKYELFDEDEIGGDGDVDLTAENCVKLGAALGSSKGAQKVGLASDGGNGTEALTMAIMSGLLSVGANVWNFGECFEAQLSYFTSFCGLNVGVFVRGGERPSVCISGAGGLPLGRSLEREIEKRYDKSDFVRCEYTDSHDVSDMGSVRMMYQQALCRQAPNGLYGISADVQCEDERIEMFMEDCLKRLECKKSQELVFNISVSGKTVTAHYKDSLSIQHEMLLAVCVNEELSKGHDVAVPFDAPFILDELKNSSQGRLLRYLHDGADNSDSDARLNSRFCPWVRDGLFMTVKLLSIMKERNKSLRELFDELPIFAVKHDTFNLPVKPSELSDILNKQKKEFTFAREGIKMNRDSGRLLLTPSKNGRKLYVMAEAANMETAEELCADVSNLLNKSLLDSKTDR